MFAPAPSEQMPMLELFNAKDSCLGSGPKPFRISEQTTTWDGVPSRERMMYETIKKDNGFSNSHGNGAGDDQHGVRSLK